MTAKAVTLKNSKGETEMKEENRFFTNSSWTEEEGERVIIAAKDGTGSFKLTHEEAKAIIDEIKHYLGN